MALFRRSKELTPDTNDEQVQPVNLEEARANYLNAIFGKNGSDKSQIWDAIGHYRRAIKVRFAPDVIQPDMTLSLDEIDKALRREDEARILAMLIITSESPESQAKVAKAALASEEAAKIAIKSASDLSELRTVIDLRVTGILYEEVKTLNSKNTEEYEAQAA